MAVWHLQVSFFSDGDEAPSTPKADVMFVPRENPRSLFIRQPESSPAIPSAAKDAVDVGEIATPVQKDGTALTIVDSAVNRGEALAGWELDSASGDVWNLHRHRQRHRDKLRCGKGEWKVSHLWRPFCCRVGRLPG